MQKRSLPEMELLLQEYQPLVDATVYLAPIKSY